MTDKIKLVQGDTRPALLITITDQTTGQPIDLTGCTVVMKFRAYGSETLQATVTGSIVSGPVGSAVFYPASAPAMLQGDPGDYEGEVEITFPDGQVQTIYDPLKFKVREEF